MLGRALDIASPRAIARARAGEQLIRSALIGGSAALDRFIIELAPRYGLGRVRARALARLTGLALRHYEAASIGRRTQNWNRSYADANLAALPSLPPLRAHSRDLIRNNGWARNAVRAITRDVVGWGITPKAASPIPAQLAAAWKDWSQTTACDAAGRLTFPGIQKLIMRGIVESGEMLIRRRWRRPTDNLPLPIQLQVLEPDYIDTSRTTVGGMAGQAGGPIIQGIEFDAIGRRAAYWLFENHPGSFLNTNPMSRRVDASEIIHVYDLERAGQDRGVPWLAAAILKLKDFDEFEDAQLMKQKVAALLAGVVTNIDGDPLQIGSPDGAVAPGAGTQPIQVLEPGILQELKPGQDIKFTTPPSVTEDGFSVRTLRAIAAAVGITYEDLTGDFSQVNFSSARMSRLAKWGNVYDWQWNMLIPQFCDPVWAWAMEAAQMDGFIPASITTPRAEWTPAPMPMTDPDKEARANVTRIRSGAATLSEVIREQGRDPESHLAEYAADMKRLDDLEITLDCDPRKVSQTGQAQQKGSAPEDGAGAAPDETPPPAPKKKNGAAKGAATTPAA